MSEESISNKPKFITFTGIDDRTDVDRLSSLSQLFSLEFGVLLSGNNRDSRFPSAQAIEEFSKSGVSLSAHLCGSTAKEFVSRGKFPDYASIDWFDRIQVNGRFNQSQFAGYDLNPKVILQSRGNTFPESEKVLYLLDKSGGKGRYQMGDLPEHRSGELSGYSGGLNPVNVRQFITRIHGDGQYWIDMESGVRSNGWFDVAKAYRVCREVYENHE